MSDLHDEIRDLIAMQIIEENSKKFAICDQCYNMAIGSQGVRLICETHKSAGVYEKLNKTPSNIIFEIHQRALKRLGLAEEPTEENPIVVAARKMGNE